MSDQPFEVAEGIHGTFYYHLWKKPPMSSAGAALCGERVMVTSIPRSAWATMTSHIKERWCSRCAALEAEAQKKKGGRK